MASTPPGAIVTTVLRSFCEQVGDLDGELFMVPEGRTRDLVRMTYTETTEDTMPTETYKTLVRRFYDEALNARSVQVIDELALADYAEHDPLPGQRDGLVGLKDRVSMLTQGLASTYTVHDMIACGDRVVVRWTNAGVHSGEFLGIPPTGRSFDIAGIDIYRIENGRMAEHWHVVDQLTMLQQLGLIPAPDSAPV
jgi:predicted ester cyclase